MTGEHDGVPMGERDSGPYEERAGRRAGAAGVVAGLGAFYLVRHLSTGAGLAVPREILELPFLLLSLTLLYAGYWLLRCDFCHRRVGRVAAWSVAGFVGLAAIAVWLVAGQHLPLQRTVLLAMDVGAVGASSGLLVGLEGERRYRRIDRDAVDAERAAEIAEERFAFMNRLLRHHLLNGVGVIRGHAELLAERFEEPPEEVDIIRRRSDEVVGLVQNVETLGRAFAGDLPRGSVDPVPPLRDAIDAVRRERPAVAVQTELEEVTRVVGTTRIGLAFEALLRVAVESAGDGPVTVSTESMDGVVVVSFAVEGPARPPPAPSIDPESHGEGDLGGLLAETLIEYFGGEVVVPGEDGALVSVRLRAAD